MTLPCGTLSVNEQCKPTLVDNGIGVQLAKTRVGASVRDRTMLEPGEGFELYILDDVGQYIVDDLGQYIISG